MYAYIKGIVDEKGIDRAVVEAAGVGYELLCPDSTLREITAGREAKLLAHFNITQDGVALYGFYTKEEREMFRRLIAVNRVGPKLALSILSKLSPQDIAMAIVTQNAAAFDRPGSRWRANRRLSCPNAYDSHVVFCNRRNSLLQTAVRSPVMGQPRRQP